MDGTSRQSVLVVEVVVLIAFGDVLDGLPLLLLGVLLLHSFFEIGWDLLLHGALGLPSYNIEAGTIFFDDVLGPDVAVDFLGLVVVAEGFSPGGLFVGVADWVVAQAGCGCTYPLELRLLSTCTFWW